MNPGISVVIPTDRFETIERVVASLRRQTACGSIELVIVTPRGSALSGHERELESLQSVRVVEADTTSLSRARAAGSAPRAQTWSPSPSRTRSRSPAGPSAYRRAQRAMGRGWPRDGQPPPSRQCRLGRLHGRLRTVGPARRTRARGRPPGHNSSYKRALLLDYGPELERMLDAEWLLHKDLQRRGYALYLEPAAMSRHVSPSRLVPSIVQWFHYSRGFATSRSRGWPGARRALYAAGSPLIVLVRLRAGDRRHASHGTCAGLSFRHCR